MARPISDERAKTFEVAQQRERKARLQHENARLKKLVDELTLERQKATKRCGHEPPLAHDRPAQRAGAGTDSGAESRPLVSELSEDQVTCISGKDWHFNKKCILRLM